MKWKPQDQLHITIKFYGLIDETEIPSLIRQIDEKLIEFPEFSLGVSDPGVFPNLKHPRTMWFGLTGDVEKLTALAMMFADDQVDQPFVSHITVGTLAKSLPYKQKEETAQKFLQTRLRKPQWFKASEIVLFRSKLTRSNPIYTKIATFQLG